jgi:septum site-determining protein MinC
VDDASPLDLGHEALPEQSSEDNITLKGRGDGVAVELGNGDWSRLMAKLDSRLEQAASFFRGGQVSLNVGARPLVETELDQVCGVLQKYGLSVGIVRTGSDRTFQSALNLGLAATMENAGGETMTEATFSASNLGGQTHFVYRGTLRSGQVLQRQESILIIGDVNPGGHVISAGDIMVWGRLQGVVHAGAEGDLNVIVGALALEPTQLRIADIIAIDDRGSQGRRGGDREEAKPAQIAFVVEGKLLVRPWQEARRGFRSVLRGP